MNDMWAAPTALFVGIVAAMAVVLLAVVSRRVVNRSARPARAGLGSPGAGGRWHVVGGHLIGTNGTGRQPTEPEEGVGLGGIVEPGRSAVVATVRQGAFARLVGPGPAVRLAPDERPHRAVVLDPVELSGAVEGALSRDAVPVRRLEWRAAVQVRARPDTTGVPGDPYPFDPYAARLAAFGPADLVEALRTEVEDALTEAVRTIEMRGLFDPAAETPPLDTALAVARSNLADTIESWGLTVVVFKVRRVTLDPDVQEHLTAVWHAKTERQVRGLMRQADVEADAVIPTQDAFGPRHSAGKDPSGARDIGTKRQRVVPPESRPPSPPAARSPMVPERTQPVPAARSATTPPARTTPLAKPRRETDRQPAAIPAVPRLEVANAVLPGYDDVNAETLAGLRAAAAAVRAARGGGATATATPNPVSFSSFLGSLRERARGGDDVAESVLRQLMEVMARIDSGAATGRSDPRAARSEDRQPSEQFVQPTLDID